MAWSDTPTLDTGNPARAWFPEPPNPAAPQHEPYWRAYHQATLAAELADLDAQLSGGQTQSGELAAALHRIVFAGTAEKSYPGVLAADLHPLTAFATNVLAAEATGALHGPQAALAGQQIIGGTLGATLRPVQAAATGQQLYTGTIGAALRQAAAQMQGSQIHTGILDADLTHLLLSATGQQTITGALASVLRKAVFAGVGNQAITGTLAAALRQALANLSGTHTLAPVSIAFTTVGAYTTVGSGFDIAALRAAGYTHIDRIALGGGQGGSGSSAGAANGGNAGVFNSDTIALASYPSLTAMTGTVGDGGNGGAGGFFPSDGSAGQASTCTGSGLPTLTGAGGPTGSGGGRNGDAVSSGNTNGNRDLLLNGQTYPGGSTTTSATASVPGSGGYGGGGGLAAGSKGGRGQTWLCARQVV
ncbi:hypothetical protein [Mycobacterium sp. 48b]|uniref:glycine-rich domain-containing protein n=1 Tax=Mycobacterium sp. 48b TaxID=3400426 RepID=UPI003AAD7E45